MPCMTFWVRSRHAQCTSSCLLWANSGHSITASPVQSTSQLVARVRIGVTRKFFQIRVILQHLLHVHLGTVLKSLDAIDDELSSIQQFDLFRLRLRLAGSDRMFEQTLVCF